MKKLIALALLASVSASSASAAIIHWTLHDVTFEDGTSLTGGFDVNSATNTPSNWLFVAAPGPLFTALSYTPSNSSYFGHIFGVNSFAVSAGPSRYIVLNFAQTLTVAGSVSLVAGATSYECLNCVARRQITAGYASADGVPEPAMLGLFGLGAIALGLARRRKVS